MPDFDAGDGSEGWSTWVEPYQGTPEYSYRYAVWKTGFLTKLTVGAFPIPARALAVSRLKRRTTVKHKRCLRVLFEVVDLPFTDAATGANAVRPALRTPASAGEIGEYLGPALFGIDLDDLRSRNYYFPHCHACTEELDIEPERMFEDERTELDLPPLADLLRARRTVMLPAKMRDR